MTASNLNIIASVKNEVIALLSKKLDPKFVFHNLAHTMQVAEAVEGIATFYQFSEEEKIILIIAAWFHDTGFTTGRIEGHETESIRIAQSFLVRHSIRQPVIAKVSACILATKMPQHPLSGMDKVICDADLFHLGSNNFKERTELLRLELQSYYNTPVSEREWDMNNIEFLKSHHYFTGYGQQMLEPVKQQWIKKIEKRNSLKSNKRMLIAV